MLFAAGRAFPRTARGTVAIPGALTTLMPEAPPTLEGWYALHDFRALDWPRWKSIPSSERAAALDEAAGFLGAAEAHADSPEGGSALYAIVGHKADLMF